MHVYFFVAEELVKGACGARVAILGVVTIEVRTLSAMKPACSI
jgi:hypothetical protein